MKETVKITETINKGMEQQQKIMGKQQDTLGHSMNAVTESNKKSQSLLGKRKEFEKKLQAEADAIKQQVNMIMAGCGVGVLLVAFVFRTIKQAAQMKKERMEAAFGGGVQDPLGLG